MPIGEPPERCKATIFPSWSNHWVPCTSTVNNATGRCYQYGHPRKTEEQTVTNPMGPSGPGAQDECATCSHARWRHREADGQHECTEYVDCACGGHFVELSQGTRMARFVEAAQNVAASIATMRAALQGTMRATTQLYNAMLLAGLLPEDAPTTDPQTIPGRHAADITLTAEELAKALDIPEQLITGPSPDGLPNHWGDAARMIGIPNVARPSESCTTCWPRPCDPARILCRRNPDNTQATPVAQPQEDA